MIRKVASSLLLMLFILCSAISIMRAANIQKCWQESVSTILAPHTEEELSTLEVSYPETVVFHFCRTSLMRLLLSSPSAVLWQVL